MKSVIYEFDPVIYPFPVLVSKKFDQNELCELFYVVNTSDEVEDADSETFYPNRYTIARTIEVVSKNTGNRFFLILLIRPSVIGNGTITHEATHATNMIAEICGFLPEKAMNDEPTAYLAQWVANCIGAVKEGRIHAMKGELFEE